MIVGSNPRARRSFPSVKPTMPPPAITIFMRGILDGPRPTAGGYHGWELRAGCLHRVGTPPGIWGSDHAERRGRDLNPRTRVTDQRFSRPPHSTALPPLRAQLYRLGREGQHRLRACRGGQGAHCPPRHAAAANFAGLHTHTTCPWGDVVWKLNWRVRDGGDAAFRACSSSVCRFRACEGSSLISTGDMPAPNGYHAAARRGGRAAEGIRLLSG